ncbi:MAG: glycosyltransferase family 2 protein [Pseudomonadota bacterium]
MSDVGQPYNPKVTVAVLSHRRPTLLWRVLDAVARLDYDNFEIVVIGDQPDLSAYGLPDWLSDQIKYRAFTGANICRSRNLALELAGGDVLAFVDDDAVPEPDWLKRIVPAFAFPGVAGAGGLVRRKDGVGVEWDGGVFDREAVERRLPVSDDFRIFDADSQIADNEFIGTIGANSAFRREAVLSVGGFDESFRYYLDETDLMLRLAYAGWDAAFVRTAEVHHLRAANDARDRLRVPRNFYEIAASKAYFCRRHLPGPDVLTALDRFRRSKLHEVDPYVRLGLIRGGERKELQRQIKNGLVEGLSRDPGLPLSTQFSEPAFKRFVPQAIELSVAICAGWGPKLFRSVALARSLAAAGVNVSYFSYMPGRAAPVVQFSDGVWWHRGGTWRRGKHLNGKRLFSRAARAEAEIARVHARRSFDLVLGHRVQVGTTAVEFPGYAGLLHVRGAPGARLGFEKALSRLLLAAERLSPASTRFPPSPRTEPNLDVGMMPG